MRGRATSIPQTGRNQPSGSRNNVFRCAHMRKLYGNQTLDSGSKSICRGFKYNKYRKMKGGGGAAWNHSLPTDPDVVFFHDLLGVSYEYAALNK